MRHDIAHHGVSATQWVDGSFVTSKVNPADVDVVHFIDYDALKVLAQMNPAALEFVEEYIAANDRAMLKYHTHSFLVLSCGRSHGFYNAFEKARVYWRKWWGRTRDHRVKGFVRMRVGTRPPRISDATE